MSTSFRYIRELFEKVYQQALNTKGLEYVESQGSGYVVENFADLAPFKDVDLGTAQECPVYGTAGPKDGTPVAWVWDPTGLGKVQINDGVSEDELVTLANKFYGL